MMHYKWLPPPPSEKKTGCGVRFYLYICVHMYLRYLEFVFVLGSMLKRGGKLTPAISWTLVKWLPVNKRVSVIHRLFSGVCFLFVCLFVLIGGSIVDGDWQFPAPVYKCVWVSVRARERAVFNSVPLNRVHVGSGDAGQVCIEQFHPRMSHQRNWNAVCLPLRNKEA